MPVIQVEAQVSAEQLLKAVEQMQEQEFEAFVTQVLLLRAQREAPRLSSSESQLLLKINQGLDDQLQDRFNQLIAKRQALTITDAELEELIQLTDRIEQLDAERIQSLAELARLRQRSLTEVMQDLNIQPPACV
ncbi:MAG: STAS/SEC14 domain-containing protein [Rhizonema sp. PD38]|nr:STAS/SEC14 domain-containing protein [Rhizonema sp. PD38]